MTEITPAPKEEPTPIELEKKSDAKVETKSEEVTPARSEGEVIAEPETEEKKEEEPPTINEGYLHKRTPKKFMKIWSKSYFVVGTDHIDLENLRLYHKKNVKKSLAPTTTKVPGMVNATSTTTTPAITENPPATSETAPAEPEDVEKVIPKPEEPAVETIEPTKAEEPVVEATEPPKAEESVVETAEAPNTEEVPVVETTDLPVVETTELPKPEEKVEAASTDAEKVNETKEPEDKKPETKEQTVVEEEAKQAETNVSSNFYYKNIAHATKTGNGLLFYYKSDSDARNKKPIGIINLKQVDGVDKVKNLEGAGRQFAFTIETNYRLFELSAESEAERNRWIRTIKEKIEEVDKIDVESSDEYKATYNKLEKGTAFVPQKSDNITSDTEMFSGDEDIETPKRDINNVDVNKRRSVFSNLFFGKKPSTTDHSTLVTTSETINEDGTKEVINETTEIITSEEVLKTEEIKTEEVPPKSPHKPSRFPFNISFSKKVEKGPDTKEETTEIKEEVVVKEKTTEETTKEATNAETSAETSAAAITANGEEIPEEKEEKKKGWIENFNPFKKAAGKEAQKEEITENEETNTEQTKTDTADTPTEEETRQKEHKDGIFKNLFKGKAKEETHHETKAETTEVVNEASVEDATIEAKGEGKTVTEEKSVEPSTEKQEDHTRTILGVKLPFGVKSKHTSDEKPEKSEDKVESKSDENVEPKEPANTEAKEDDKKDDKKEKKEKSKKEKKKKDNEHEKEKKEGEDSSSSESSDGSSGGVVRRVTKIWRRNKSHKTDSSHREVTIEASEESEEKKEVETSDAKSTEKVEKAPVQTSEQTIPESSNESTEEKVKKDEEKKKEKSSIFENFRRISSGIGKRQNSLPQDSTHEKVESTNAAAVASASEATDVENADKTAKIVEEELDQQLTFIDGPKKGNLYKQTQFLKNLEIRYFVLSKDKQLIYYRSDKDPSGSKTIELSDSKVGVKVLEGKPHYLFDLETKTRTFRLGAETEEERDSWIQALKEAGVALVPAPAEKEPTSSKKTEEVSTRLEVTKSETNLQEEIDAVAASVAETQEPTTTSDIVVETKEEKETTA